MTPAVFDNVMLGCDLQNKNEMLKIKKSKLGLGSVRKILKCPFYITTFMFGNNFRK